MQILIQKQCHDLPLFRDQNNNETNRLVTQNARTFYGRRTNVTGEGIFTFYSEDAKRILSKYEELCCRGTIEVITMVILLLICTPIGLINDIYEVYHGIQEVLVPINVIIFIQITFKGDT